MPRVKTKGDIVYHHPITNKDFDRNDKLIEKTGKGCLYEWHTKISEQLHEMTGEPITYHVLTKKKPIAYSTQATLEWLELLAEECNSWEEMYSQVCGKGKYLKDNEAMEVVEKLMVAKVPYEKYFS